MTVSDLKGLLEFLGLWLAEQGGKQISNDFSRLVQSLKSHEEKSISEFCDFLVAENDEDKMGLRKIDRQKPRGIDSEKVRLAAESLRGLLDKAITPQFTYEAITSEIDRLEKILNKDESLEVAREFGVSGTVKSKIGALQEIGRKIADRKTMHDRTLQIERPAWLDNTISRDPVF